MHYVLLTHSEWQMRMQRANSLFPSSRPSVDIYLKTPSRGQNTTAALWLQNERISVEISRKILHSSKICHRHPKPRTWCLCRGTWFLFENIGQTNRLSLENQNERIRGLLYRLHHLSEKQRNAQQALRHIPTYRKTKPTMGLHFGGLRHSSSKYHHKRLRLYHHPCQTPHKTCPSHLYHLSLEHRPLLVQPYTPSWQTAGVYCLWSQPAICILILNTAHVLIVAYIVNWRGNPNIYQLVLADFCDVTGSLLTLVPIYLGGVFVLSSSLLYFDGTR